MYDALSRREECIQEEARIANYDELLKDNDHALAAHARREGSKESLRKTQKEEDEPLQKKSKEEDEEYVL